jgi:hypothetical protein
LGLDLKKIINKHKPHTFYESKTDSLIYSAKDQKSYAKVVDKTLMLLFSVEDDSIIGIEISDVKNLLEEIKNESW